MKPKANIGIFIGYSKTSRGLRKYNRRTKNIMETIRVKFDELTTIASEHDSLEPVSQRFIHDDSLVKLINTPSKEDLDNLFGPMYKEYFEKRSFDAPPIVTTSEEQTSLISLTGADEFNQEDSIDFDEYTMEQPQRQADVYQDELCPPNKRYALMDANKKIDLENTLCPNESKLLEDRSKYKLSFVVDKKELTMTLDDFRTIFYLPQATDNNHDCFVPALKFSKMVLFYINNLGFTLELRSPSNFKTTGLMQPWQPLCKMSDNTRFYYSLEHLTKLIPYPIFTKPIVSNYMTSFLEISRRAHDKYHNLEDDEMIKRIFKSGKNKAGVGMKIFSWMITDEMKPIQNNRMYDAVFGVDVPITQSQLIESLRIHSTLISLDTEKLHEVTVNDPPFSSSTPSSSSPKPKLSASQHILSSFKPKIGRFERYISFFDEIQGRYGYLFEHLKTKFMPRNKFHVLAQHLQEIMEGSLPKMIDAHVQELTKTNVSIYVAHGLIMERQQSQDDVEKIIANAIQQECETLQAKISSQINNAITNHIPSHVDSSVRTYMSGHILHGDLPIWLALKYKFERLHVSDTSCKPSSVRPRDQDDPYDDAHLKGENSAKKHKIFEHGTYVFGESSSGQDNESELGPSTSCNQEQLDDFDF
nr:hypothetical protein [Tanacetum cinerariifolium]